MNSEGVDDDGHSDARGHVAEALDEDEIHDRLLVGQASIQRDVHEVGLDRDLGRYRAVERRDWEPC